MDDLTFLSRPNENKKDICVWNSFMFALQYDPIAARLMLDKGVNVNVKMEVN